MGLQPSCPRGCLATDVQEQPERLSPKLFWAAASCRGGVIVQTGPERDAAVKHEPSDLEKLQNQPRSVLQLIPVWCVSPRFVLKNWTSGGTVS